MTEDAKQLSRQAQFLVVEAKQASGSPPQYPLGWLQVWQAHVERIEKNCGARPSICTIRFETAGWDEDIGLMKGDMVRVRTDEVAAEDWTIVFQGFITNTPRGFSGGTQQGGSFEHQAVVCQSYAWLLAVTSPIYGQYGRAPDNYDNYGQVGQSPKVGKYQFFSCRRCIFNANGRPNRDPQLLKLLDEHGQTAVQMPIFGNADNAEPWTVRQMLQYTLGPLSNSAYRYLPIDDPATLFGLPQDPNNQTTDDWDTIIADVSIDGLSVPAAVEHLCRQVGWSFREQWLNDGTGKTLVTFAFYKIGAADAYDRDAANDIVAIRHHLYAPAAGEDITAAVQRGEKMLWAAEFEENIEAVVNNPWGLGAPHRFEFTAELVPAWLDTDLVPDTSESNANLFFSEADLAQMSNPNAKSFYQNYHARGNQFKRDVGRLWALNESGRYSLGFYDRGMPFDFAGVVPAKYIKNSEGKLLYGPFNRRLLPCLTVDKESLSSVGIKVEFSFDAGQTWQVIPAAIVSLSDQAGIYIGEANLAELVDQQNRTISGGTLDGIQLNYWTSLCDDKLNSRSFKNNQWKTRVCITASIQLDQRLMRTQEPSNASGSPFHQRRLLDFSSKYFLQERISTGDGASVFASTDLPSDDRDDTAWFDDHLEAVREANEDQSISGHFTLERLWLSDGNGWPAFDVGDQIEKITGRNYSLKANFGSALVYPEIVQVLIMPEKQKMKLITRDLRFSEAR